MAQGIKPAYDLTITARYPNPTNNPSLRTSLTREKPAMLTKESQAEIAYWARNVKDAKQKEVVPQSDVDCTVAVLNLLGLKHQQRQLYNPAGATNTTISVARDQQTLQALLCANPLVDASSRETMEYGKLMGYPVSAIEAFIAGSGVSDESLPDDDKSFFNMFLFSPHYWYIEREVPKLWERTVAQGSLTLTEKIRSYEAWERKHTKSVEIR